MYTSRFHVMFGRGHLGSSPGHPLVHMCMNPVRVSSGALYCNVVVHTVTSDLLSRAMASSAAKEQFLRQMEQIVEGIKQNRIKVRLARLPGRLLCYIRGLLFVNARIQSWRERKKRWSELQSERRDVGKKQ